MNKQTLYYALPISGHQFKGEVFSMNQLSAKFQVWCKQFDIDDTESMSLWFVGSEKEKILGAPEIVKEMANFATNKLPESKEVVDLSEI